jgi:hypothetical protein
MLCVFGVKSAMADLRTARIAVPDAELVGQGRLKFLFWNVFDASLYAPDGTWSRDEPFALSVPYLRDPEFSRRFFDIWLGEETPRPELRAQLLDETS